MSDHLVRDLERHGVAIRDRSEVVELHGADGKSGMTSKSFSIDG